MISTLLIHATGAPRWERVAIDTLTGSLGLTQSLQTAAARLPPRWQHSRFVRSLLSDGYANLSYVHDWLQAFRQTPALRLTICNINNALEYRAALRRIGEYELVVILHSAAGDNMSYISRSAAALQARRGKLLVFFGNEYNLMPEKIGFARSVGADYIASQLPEAAAQWLYTDCTTARVLPAPPALNPEMYRSEAGVRPIDIGFRGDAYWPMIGDTERTDFIRYVVRHAQDWNLTQDIEFTRYSRTRWAGFLNQCRGIVGAESGTYYLERDDRTQTAVRQYLRRRPDASFSEIHEAFFKPYHNPVNGKAISSRHFEPIGTKTCQLLLEGRYNGILAADEHYISVKKDYSNIKDAVERLRDETYRRAMVDRAYDYALSRHTYRHRVDALLKAVA